MFHLVFADKVTPLRQTLEMGETVVGRSATCDIIIDDPSVSRRQARVAVMGARCKLLDLDSTNGTFVNGEPVTEAELKDDDVVTFGDIPARVEWAASDRLALTEDRELIASEGTVYRPLGPAAAEQTSGAVVATVDGRRLLKMMSEISRTLVKPQPLLTMLNTVVDLALGSIGADRAFLMLVDEGTSSVVPRVVRSRDGSSIERATVSSTVVSRAMKDRVAILAQDAQSNTWLAGRESILRGNIRSFMCVPLWSQEAVIGALYVDNPYTREFSSEDLDLFTALSEYAAVAIEQARLGARVLEETRRRERLQRYHSPAVVDRILADSGEGGSQMTAQEREVSVIFCDVVGFTTMSERLGPNEVARVLNRYFSRMTDVVFEHEGTLDKFIGDAVMAVFGAPLDQPDHAARAVRAAQSMRRALRELNAQHVGEPLEVRIGINSGSVTAGDIGSPKRREDTGLGGGGETRGRGEGRVS